MLLVRQWRILDLPINEWSATYQENLFRLELDLPLREYYKSNLNINTGKYSTKDPRVLDKSNKSMEPQRQQMNYINKKIIKFIIIITLISNCTVKNFEKVKYFRYLGNNSFSNFYFNIPCGYDKNIINAGNENEEYYQYTDSSVFYITPQFYSLEFNLKNLDKYKNCYIDFIIKDSVLLSGVDENKKYWKHIKLKNISFGYENVSQEKLTIFEEIINSMIVEKK